MAPYTEVVLAVDRRAMVKTANLGIIVLISFLAILKMVLVGVNPPPIPAILLVAGCTANVVYLSRGGASERAAVALVSILMLGLISGSLNTGGFSGPVVLLSPLVPLVSMLLISYRAALITLLLVGLILVGLYLLDIYQVIPENPYNPTLLKFGRFVSVISISLVATGMMWELAREFRAALAKVRGESNTDYLTGIFNRRAIESILLHEISRSKRDGTWLSFIIADIDHFKLYNDSNGHLAGDRCLIKVAETIRACCRRGTDVVGRFGGEEFVVILPGTEPIGACKIAENCRQSMETLNIPYGPDDLNPVTMTLGCVSIPGNGVENIDQIIKLADDALYCGKDQGRNRAICTVAGESIQPQIESGKD